jgi:hypothetical protein
MFLICLEYARACIYGAPQDDEIDYVDGIFPEGDWEEGALLCAGGGPLSYVTQNLMQLCLCCLNCPRL